MGSVNTDATHKFVIVLNEKSPMGKLLSATGQLAMSLQQEATSSPKSSPSLNRTLCQKKKTSSLKKSPKTKKTSAFGKMKGSLKIKGDLISPIKVKWEACG